MAGLRVTEIYAGYVHLRSGTVARTVTVTEDMMADVDDQGRILGVEVLANLDWRDALVRLAMSGRLRVDKPPAAGLYC